MRLQLTPFGSLNKNPIYIGKVQRAVDGRVIVLITTIPSLGVKLLSPIIRFLEGLSMRNFYSDLSIRLIEIERTLKQRKKEQ
jgi:hypothetical protein